MADVAQWQASHELTCWYGSSYHVEPVMLSGGNYYSRAGWMIDRPIAVELTDGPRMCRPEGVDAFYLARRAA